MTRLLLLDADNLLVRAERATDRVPLHADGVSTAALLVFANSLTRHVREEAPDQVVVCWDGGKSAYRTGLHPGYKANRPARVEAPDVVRPHGLAKRWLTLSGVMHVERPGWEADDLIAAYCAANAQDVDEYGRPAAEQIVIISSDHDLLQLVGPTVTQVKVATGDHGTDRWDADRVCERYAIPAVRHLPEVLALAGDPGDGCPGLPGVGLKRAVKMLAAAGWDWTTLLRQLADDETPGREWWAEAASLGYDLVDLRARPYATLGLQLAAPGPFRPTGPADALWADLTAFLDRYELRSVSRRLARGELWKIPS